MSKFREWCRLRRAEGAVGLNRQLHVRVMASRKITSALFLNRAGEMRRAGKLSLARWDIENARQQRVREAV